MSRLRGTSPAVSRRTVRELLNSYPLYPVKPPFCDSGLNTAGIGFDNLLTLALKSYKLSLFTCYSLRIFFDTLQI
jgi:hypothetical protein